MPARGHEQGIDHDALGAAERNAAHRFGERGRQALEEGGLGQCDISTGTVMLSSMVRVAPPRIH